MTVGLGLSKPIFNYGGDLKDEGSISSAVSSPTSKCLTSCYLLRLVLAVGVICNWVLTCETSPSVVDKVTAMIADLNSSYDPMPCFFIGDAYLQLSTCTYLSTHCCCYVLRR
jgi:hypothetical protein